MRIVVALALAVASLAGCPRPPPPAAPVPRPAPALAAVEAAPDLDGRVVGPRDGRPTIVVVFASWCGHCHHALAELATLGDGVRVLGVNYRGHEEYDHRGDSAAVRRYVAEHAPWLRVVPAGEVLFRALGRPPKVPTLYVYDRGGALVARYDRRERAIPDARELRAVLRR